MNANKMLCCSGSVVGLVPRVQKVVGLNPTLDAR